MSWDVLVTKVDPKIPFDEYEEKDYPEIEPVDVIYKKLKKSIKGLSKFSDYMSIANKQYSGSISIGHEGEISTSIMFFVYDGSDPLGLIVEVCKKNNWVAYDTTSGKYIDLDNPSDTGWVEHQKFVNSIKEKFGN